MKTIQAIVDLANATHAGEVMAMATVMKVRGSAYRRPGARMLTTQNGRSVGLISGGCLESDVRERAQAVMKSGKPVLVTYDSTAPEDIVFGLGLGCNGVMQVLIEPLTAGDGAGIIAFFAACLARRQSGRIATVFSSDNVPLGTRLMRWPDGAVTSSKIKVAGALLKVLQKNAAKRTAVRWIDLPDGTEAGVLIETIAPSVPLTIFGAGDDALPLAQMAKLVGWHVTIIDARPAFAKAERFPMADAVHCLRPESLHHSTQVVFPPESMVMIMTHSFTTDKALLAELLPRGLRYVGVLGPKARAERLIEELAHEGARFTEADLARLHGPAGLDIGSETPEEIAVSILSEMQAVLAQRAGGQLRDICAPIHDPVENPVATK
jgi:xanthine dehydrogenase accessory factor